MNSLDVRIKRLNDLAVIPTYAHASDAGLDLVATSKEYDELCNVVYGTGIAVEIPEGYVGLVFPRSSNAKKCLWLTNHVGVIDSGYRGEIKLKYRSSVISSPHFLNAIREFFGFTPKYNVVATEEYAIGDKIGQLIIMPYPKVNFNEVDFLFPSDRGEGGYGSTGK